MNNGALEGCCNVQNAQRRQRLSSSAKDAHLLSPEWILVCCVLGFL